MAEVISVTNLLHHVLSGESEVLEFKESFNDEAVE